MVIQKILHWVIDNWKDIAAFGGGIFAVIKGGMLAVKWYKKITAPLKAWINKMDKAAEQLQFNGGTNIKDMVFKTNQTVEKIAKDLTVVKHRQTAMLELNNEAIFEADNEGFCIKANAALCTLFGATSNQLLGYGWLHYIKNSEDEKEAWEQAIESDNEIQREYTILVGRDKTNEIQCSYIAHIKRDEFGKVVNVTGKVIKL